MTTTQAEWELALVGTDDEPGLLDNYFMGHSAGLIFWLCRRCPNGHVSITARNLDGDQTNLTLGEMAQAALVHERENHTPEPEPCGETWTDEEETCPAWVDRVPHSCVLIGGHRTHRCVCGGYDGPDDDVEIWDDARQKRREDL